MKKPGNFFIFMAGIYIHIPFCKRKCIYCDFYSVAAKPGVVESYVEALCREMDLRCGELQGETVRTVYIGGGTPSLLPTGQLQRIIGELDNSFDLSSVEEFTIEVNPDDVSAVVIGEYRRSGINRVSMGVQSFVDSELEFLNRRHNAEQALRAYETITDCGIDNVSIDLIYGIPGQTMPTWRQSLDMAMRLRPKHLSCYNLSYEEGTRLSRMLDNDEIREVDDAVCVKMYESMVETLADNDYEHYEISNFALPGCYSRHNSNYWNKTAYLGIGASAHSYIHGIRCYNPDNIKSYISLIGDGKTATVAEEECIGEKYDEEIMLRLRTSSGIDVSLIRFEYGEPYYSHFITVAERFIKIGLMERTGEIYRLSRRGVMLADMVIRELMYVEG